MSAHAYDDTAIVACETMVQKELSPSISYRRLSAHVIGATVSLEFEKAFSSAKPQTQKITCKFKHNRDGSWIFDLPVTDVPDHCRNIKASSKEQLNKLSEDELKRLLAIGKDCVARLRQEVAFNSSHLRTLYEAGLYPIKLSDTALRDP